MSTSSTYNVQIKRYNSSNDWDIINPKTTIENVSGLQSALGNINTAINNVVALAEGKTKSYVIDISSTLNPDIYDALMSDSTTPDPNFQYVDLIPNITLIDGTTTVSASNLKVGDIIYILSTSVPDLWVSAVTNTDNATATLRKLETTKVDLSTYQPLDADLTAIAELSGTSGLLKKTAANTWSLDTNTYATQSWVNGKGYTTNTGTVTSVTLTSGNGISVSDSGTAITTTGSRTISLSTSGVTSGSYGSSTATEYKVPYITVDTYGRVTAASTVTLPVSFVYTETGTALFNQAGAFNLYKSVARTSVGSSAPETNYAGDIWFDTN